MAMSADEALELVHGNLILTERAIRAFRDLKTELARLRVAEIERDELAEDLEELARGVVQLVALEPLCECGPVQVVRRCVVHGDAATVVAHVQYLREVETSARRLIDEAPPLTGLFPTGTRARLIDLLNRGRS